jgi:hypothetical protein
LADPNIPVTPTDSLNLGIPFVPSPGPTIGPTTSAIYGRNGTSYSGCDIRAVITDSRTGTSKIIGNIATLSYSIHREKFPVRGLGRTYAKDYTRGPRTIAGTMVFNIFDRYALYDVAAAKSKFDTGIGESANSLLGDQMAPFDINCVFMNELGDMSTLNLYGIELVDEGQVMSINDIYIESTHSFVARDIDVMFPYSQGALQAARVPFFNPDQVLSFDTQFNDVRANPTSTTGQNF